MFKFLFGRTRVKIYRVYYSLRGSSFILATPIAATSEYEANRKFDHFFPEDHVRIPDRTEQIT